MTTFADTNSTLPVIELPWPASNRDAAGFQEPGLRDPEIQKCYYYVDTGLIAGNVFLFAAAEGLAAWFHNCDKAALARKLGLRADQRVLFAQSIGYPAA